MYWAVLLAFTSGFCVLADELELEHSTAVPPALSEENYLEDMDLLTTGFTEAIENLEDGIDNPIIGSVDTERTPQQVTAASPMELPQISFENGKTAEDIVSSTNVTKHKTSYSMNTTSYAEISALLKHSLEEVYLEKPQLELCQAPIAAFSFNNEVSPRYYISTKDFRLEYVDSILGKVTTKRMSWVAAANECRKRCLELISIDTEDEYRRVMYIMEYGGSQSIWTSGRRCDFTGCQKYEDPRNVGKHSWFWTGTKQWIPVTIDTPKNWRTRPWSSYGVNDLPQPDNAQGYFPDSESCLAVTEDHDEINWYDAGCHLEKDFICVGSKTLIAYAEKLYNVTLELF